MFELNSRFQIAAMFALAVIIIDYCKNPHLKLLSTKCFRLLLWMTGINLCLDLLTVHLADHIGQVSPFLNRLCHQLFIASIILVIFFNYLYISILANQQKRMNGRKWLLTLIPLIISFLVIGFGNLNAGYEYGEMAYSSGTAVYTVYACGTAYLLLGVKISFEKRADLTGNQRRSVRIGLGIWCIVMAAQLYFPQLRLSGMGFVLLVLSIYFSYENQKENFDSETGCFNKNAFHRMLSEYYEKGKTLYLVNLACENLDRISSLVGHEQGMGAMKYLSSLFSSCTGKEVYHSRSRVLSIFVTEDMHKMIDRLHRLEVTLAEESYLSSKLYCHMTVMDLRKFISSKDEVFELMHFMEEKYQGNDCKIYFLNEDIVNEKRRKNKIDLFLNEALQNQGFEMVYQPIYHTREKCFRSAEALVRLKNTGDLGYVSPEEFIPIAEEKGMIMEIGDRTLALVSEFIREADLLSSPLQYIEVNLSAIQASSPRLDKRFAEIMQKYQIPASFINLEITETATINFGKIFTENINRLRDTGFSFSMDDFGTGYSNLAQMNEIRYDLVKLDKSLIWPAFEEDEGKAGQAEKLLSSVIRLLHHIGVKIVAEGVETEEMADYLTEKGVEYLQGYYFSRPMDREQFLEFMNQK